MNNIDIPVLEKISNTECFKNSFKELYKDIWADTEEFFDKYESGILDIFSKQLREDTKDLELLSNEYFLFSYENNYLNFIEEVFNNNDKTCIINLEFSQLDDISFLEKMNNGLDKTYQLIFLNNYLKLQNTGDGLFYIKDKNLLKLFFTLLLRESSFINYLFFPNENIIIGFGYDRSIPVHSFTKESLNNYRKKSKEFNLFIR